MLQDFEERHHIELFLLVLEHKLLDGLCIDVVQAQTSLRQFDIHSVKINPARDVRPFSGCLQKGAASTPDIEERPDWNVFAQELPMVLAYAFLKSIMQLMGRTIFILLVPLPAGAFHRIRVNNITRRAMVHPIAAPQLI